MQGERVKVKNGTVRPCHEGVVVEGEGRHRVGDVWASFNRGRGFSVTSERNKLDRNNAIKNEEAGFLVESNRNNLTKKASNENGKPGYHARGQGYVIQGERNKLKQNKAWGNWASGSSIQGNRQNLTQNLSQRNFYGYRVSGEGRTLKKNIATYNDNNAIEVMSSPTSATKIKLIQNVAEYNGKFGIRTNSTVEGTIITRNTARNNNQLGRSWCRDLMDVYSDCGTHRWSKYEYDTSNRACIE